MAYNSYSDPNYALDPLGQNVVNGFNRLFASGVGADIDDLNQAKNNSPYGQYIDTPSFGPGDYDWYNPISWFTGNSRWRDRITSAYQRLRDMEYENTAYQRAVEDLKKAGFNPYWIMNNGGNINTVSNPSSYYQETNKTTTLPETATKLAMVLAVLIKAFA